MSKHHKNISHQQNLLSDSKKNRIRDKFINVLLLIFSTLICLLFLEWGSRKIIPQYYLGEKLKFEVDEQLFLRGKKNTTARLWDTSYEFNVSIEFNQYGFRDPKNLKHSRPSDLFLLGDSYSFGWGVEEKDRFSDLLQNDSLAIYNIAIPNDLIGYRNMLKYAKQQGAQIQKLMLGICMENDLIDYDTTATFPPSLTMPDYTLWGRTKNWLKYNSCFYYYISTSIKSSKFLNNLLFKIGIIKKVKSFSIHDHINKVSLSSADLLQQIVRPYKSLILIIPSRFLWIGADANRQAENLLHQRFVDILKQRNLIVVDIKPILEATGAPLGYYFEHDGHWNEKGHRLAAETLEKFLQNYDWESYSNK